MIMNAAQKAIMKAANEAYNTEVRAAKAEFESKHNAAWKTYKASGATVDSNEWKTLNNIASRSGVQCDMRILRAKKAWYAARERALALAD
jgi:hypothetical protein